MVIIFDVNKLAPHEALVQASQKYDKAAMAKDDWPYTISQRHFSVSFSQTLTLSLSGTYTKLRCPSIQPG